MAFKRILPCPCQLYNPIWEEEWWAIDYIGEFEFCSDECKQLFDLTKGIVNKITEEGS